MLSRSDNVAAPQTFANSFTSVTFQPMPLTFTPGGTIAAPTDATSYTLLAVEKVERSLIANYDDWVAYHHLTGDDADRTADSDGDGLINALEAFFGRNPWVAETDPVLTVSPAEIHGQPVVIIEFDRATSSPSVGIRFESSEALNQWLEATGLTEEVQPLTAGMEHVRLIAARDVPVRFFRAVAILGNGQ